MSADTFTLSSLVCSSILHPNLLSFMYIRYYIFVFFVLSSSRSAFLYLAMGELQPRGLQCQPAPLPSASSACAPHHCVMSSPLKGSAVVAGLSFSALHHRVRVINTILHRIAACYCYLCKNMVLLQEDKQNLTVDYWYLSRYSNLFSSVGALLCSCFSWVKRLPGHKRMKHGHRYMWLMVKYIQR